MPRTPSLTCQWPFSACDRSRSYTFEGFTRATGPVDLCTEHWRSARDAVRSLLREEGAQTVTAVEAFLAARRSTTT